MISQQWTRLSAWSLLSILVQTLAAGWQFLLAWLIGGSSVLSRTDLGADTLWMVLIIGGLVLLATHTVWTWWFFHWRLDAQRIDVRRGLLFRKRLQLSFDRIQRIDVTTPLWYRPLGRVNVVLESAGSAQQEVTLAALRSDQAEWLRAEIRGHQQGSAPQPETGTETGEPAVPLHQLSLTDLVRVGVSSPTALIIFPLVWAGLAQLPAGLRTLVSNWLDGILSSSAQGGWLMQLTLGVLTLFGMLVLSLLASIALTAWRWYGFVLHQRVNELLRQRAGLVSVHEQDLRPVKVQQIIYRRNPLQRALGVGHLKLTQATSSENDNSAFVIPGAGAELAQRMVQWVHRQPDAGSSEWIPIARSWYGMAIRLAVVFPAMLALLAALYLGLGPWPALVLLMLWLPLFAILARKRYRYWAWRREGNLLSVRSGLLGTREVTIDLNRVQRVDLRQSPYQRRRDVATLMIWVPAGLVTLPFIPLHTARQLTSLGLWRASTTSAAWM